MTELKRFRDSVSGSVVVVDEATAELLGPTFKPYRAPRAKAPAEGTTEPVEGATAPEA